MFGMFAVYQILINRKEIDFVINTIILMIDLL